MSMDVQKSKSEQDKFLAKQQVAKKCIEDKWIPLQGHKDRMYSASWHFLSSVPVTTILSQFLSEIFLG